MTILGRFESHLTVTSVGSEDREPLHALAASVGMKVTHIVLARGNTPSQVMLTKHSQGSLDDTRAELQKITAHLRSSAFHVCRTKIEIEANHPACPVSNSDAANAPEERYYESHVKVLISAGPSVTLLDALARRHSAHLSRNALRVRSDGREERFLTQRFYATGRVAAMETFQSLTADLRHENFQILDCETEYVVFDSNTGLDSGWIDAPLRT